MLDTAWQTITSASWAEQLATVLGLVAVWLMAHEKIWNFPIGLVQVTLIGSVFLRHRLFADTFLQCVYFIALAYGWWSWTHPGPARKQLPVTRLTPPQLAACVALGLLLTTGWSRLLAHLGDPAPWRDAFLATFGVLCQWLQARKKIDAWIGWIALNAVAISVYAGLGLHLFIGLYAVYLALACVGLRAWHTSMAHAETA